MQVRDGDLVALIGEGKKRRRVRLVKALLKPQHVRGIGSIAPQDLVGRSYGSTVILSNKSFLIIVPSLEDFLSTFKRKTQIITPKDSGFIVFLAGIGDGSKVVEIGTGSGGMTLALANLVGDNGKVYSYDKKKENIEIAKENLSKTPFMDRIEFKLGDCSESIEEKDADAIVADIPEPWEVVENSWKALKMCGSFISYVPTFNQLGPLIKAMGNFGLIDTYEILERRLSIKEGAIRPKDFFPHTGYITRGRKIAFRPGTIDIARTNLEKAPRSSPDDYLG